MIRFWKPQRNWGLLVLGVWLVLHGLVALTTPAWAGVATVLAVLAIVAGVLILMGR